MKSNSILPYLKPLLVIFLLGVGPASGDTYSAKTGSYVEGSVAKYIESQNVTVFRYTDTKQKQAYFALVGKYGLSVRTTLGKKIGSFKYGGAKHPRTVTRYRIYEGQIIGNSIYLSSFEHTKISRRTAHMKLLEGNIFEDRDKMEEDKKIYASAKREEKNDLELDELIAKRNEALNKLDIQYLKAVERLMNSKQKQGDVEGAKQIASYLGSMSNHSTDELVGTSWNFLGVKKQRINRFLLSADGSIECEHTYKTASWSRLDDSHILFQYGAGSTYIVFAISGDNMAGYNAAGRVRYLSKIK